MIAQRLDFFAGRVAMLTTMHRKEQANSNIRHWSLNQ